MTTTNEKPLVEVHDGVEYRLAAVKTGKPAKCVGLAPTKVIQGDTDDDKLEWLTNEYGSKVIVECFERKNIQDAENAVRGKYNKDKVTPTQMYGAIASGQLTPEMQREAWDQVGLGKYKDFTEACCAMIGFGEAALDKANPSHIHWDCAR